MPRGEPPSPCDDLITVRDWLRYGVSRFRAASLVYGHGTASDIDEAAYLILHTLSLPIDDLDPWLDARLTVDERTRVLAIFEKRIATRKPASYLTGEAWIKGRRFFVDERVIVPRSFIGELLCEGFDWAGPEPASIARVLDLCTGSGCLAILAAELFPEAAVDAADISADALEVAARNVAEHGLEARVRLVRSDLFAQLGGERYDLIVSNPPYVTQAAIDAFPPEYKAEPVLAHLGGTDGLDLVRRILSAAPEHLTKQGQIVVEIGQGRELLEQEYPDLPFLWLDTETSAGEVFALPASALRSRSRTRG